MGMGDVKSGFSTFGRLLPSKKSPLLPSFMSPGTGITDPIPPPPLPDKTAAMIRMLAYADTQRKIRQGAGRKSMFFSGNATSPLTTGTNGLLGQ